MFHKICAGITTLGCYSDTNVFGSSGNCYAVSSSQLTVAYCISLCLSACPTCAYALVAKKDNSHVCCDCVATLDDAALTPFFGKCTSTCDDGNPCGDPSVGNQMEMNAYSSEYPPIKY